MPHADLTALIDAAGGESPRLPTETAANTAAALLAAARDGSGDPARLVAVADRIGIDTLAALWRPADPVSTAGALWALYLLRHWCYENPATVVRLWRAGEPVMAADAVVAGVDGRADDTAVREAADAILTRAFIGDFGVALDHGAALFRVLGAGRRQLGDGAGELAGGNESAAGSLSEAARLWRAGQLS